MTFRHDHEKMFDFLRLTKPAFLNSYSYLTEEEYDRTAADCAANPITNRELLLFGMAAGEVVHSEAPHLHWVITTWVSPVARVPEMTCALFTEHMAAKEYAVRETAKRIKLEGPCPNWCVVLDGVVHHHNLTEDLTHE